MLKGIRRGCPVAASCLFTSLMYSAICSGVTRSTQLIWLQTTFLLLLLTPVLRFVLCQVLLCQTGSDGKTELQIFLPFDFCQEVCVLLRVQLPDVDIFSGNGPATGQTFGYDPAEIIGKVFILLASPLW